MRTKAQTFFNKVANTKRRKISKSKVNRITLVEEGQEANIKEGAKNAFPLSLFETADWRPSMNRMVLPFLFFDR